MSNKLAIFDLDGTLLNTLGDLAAGCNHMLAQRNLPQHSFEQYCYFVGNGVTRLVERALPENMRTPEYVDAARADFVAYYSENINNYTKPYGGVITMLQRLTEAGVTLAVASNKFHEGTIKLMEKHFGDFEFKAVYGNREGFPLKPDPALLQLIMAECGEFEPQQCYMIGDSGVDMQTATAAGVHAIGVSWGFRDCEELEVNGAEVICHSAAEVVEQILR